jgi:hypothetical protein
VPPAGATGSVVTDWYTVVVGVVGIILGVCFVAFKRSVVARWIATGHIRSASRYPAGVVEVVGGAMMLAGVLAVSNGFGWWGRT